MLAEGRHREFFRKGAVGDLLIPGLALSLLAVVLRLLVATRRDGIEVDGIAYLANARAMFQEGAAVDAVYPPLYSLILALFVPYWENPEWGARIVSSVLGGLWVWPTLWLARQTTGERVGLISAFLVAVAPAAVEASTRVLPEALFGLCLTGHLAALATVLRTRSLVMAGVAGVLGGLATLSRPEGMGYLVLAWGVLLSMPAFSINPISYRSVLLRIAALSIAWSLVIFPNMLLIKQQTGSWHWSGKMTVTLRWAESVGSERPDVVIERVITEEGAQNAHDGLLGQLRSDPASPGRRALINLHLLDKYSLPALLHTGGIALLVLGLVHLRFRRLPEMPEWLLVAAFLPLAGLLLFVVESRYFVSVVPVVGIISGIGLARLRRATGEATSASLSPAAKALLVVVVLSYLPWIVRPWFREEPAALEKRAGQWLLQAGDAGTVFLGRSPVIGYYARARGIPFAQRPLDDLLAEGRRAGARFLVADGARLAGTRPDLLWLVTGARVRDDLELAQAMESRDGRRLYIYRLAGR